MPSDTRALVLGTRGSALALAQARLVAIRLGARVEVRVIRTTGDDSDAPLVGMGDGVFVTAIEQALLRHEIDLAVHSLKDLPTAPRPGLIIAAVPEREDPRDVLVTRIRRGRSSLPPRARVGSSSPRRAAFLRALAPDSEIVAIRGNVETRLRKVESGEVDATVLAFAGLRRLGIAVDPSETLSLTDCPPAPGQGALAVQCRADDSALIEKLAHLDHRATRRAVEAERALLHDLGASCELARGAHGWEERGDLVLDAALGTPDGIRRASVRGQDPRVLGARAAALLGGVTV